jgi:hypothetical protein
MQASAQTPACRQLDAIVANGADPFRALDIAVAPIEDNRPGQWVSLARGDSPLKLGAGRRCIRSGETIASVLEEQRLLDDRGSRALMLVLNPHLTADFKLPVNQQIVSVRVFRNGAPAPGRFAIAPYYQTSTQLDQLEAVLVSNASELEAVPNALQLRDVLRSNEVGLMLRSDPEAAQKLRASFASASINKTTYRPLAAAERNELGKLFDQFLQAIGATQPKPRKRLHVTSKLAPGVSVSDRVICVLRWGIPGFPFEIPFPTGPFELTPSILDVSIFGGGATLSQANEQRIRVEDFNQSDPYVRTLTISRACN